MYPEDMRVDRDFLAMEILRVDSSIPTAFFTGVVRKNWKMTLPVPDPRS